MVYSGPNIAYNGTPQEIKRSLSDSKWDFYMYSAMGGGGGVPPNYPTPDQYAGAKSARFAMTDAGYLDFSSPGAIAGSNPWIVSHATLRFPAACVQTENPPTSTLATSATTPVNRNALWKWRFQAVPTEPRLDTYGVPTNYPSITPVDSCVPVPLPNLTDNSSGAALESDKLYKLTGEIFWAYSKPNDPGFPSPAARGSDLNSQHNIGYPVVTMVYQHFQETGNDAGRFYYYATLSGRMVSASRIEGFFTDHYGDVGGFVMTRCPATGCKTKR